MFDITEFNRKYAPRLAACDLYLMTLSQALDNKLVLNDDDLFKYLGYIPRRHHLKVDKYILLTGDCDIILITNNVFDLIAEIQSHIKGRFDLCI